MNNTNENTFEIYQVKSGTAYRDYRFENLESLETFGLKIEYDSYDFVYEGSLENMNLEDIFRKFNENRPEDYKGRSLSVSDVVVLNKDGEISANFVDSFGYKNVPEFLVERDRANRNEVSVLKNLENNRQKVAKREKADKDSKTKDLGDR